MSINHSEGSASPVEGGTTTPAEAPRTLRLGVSAAHSEVLVRRQLVDVLRRGARGPLTLLSAPAGYGKTVLVHSWRSAIDASVPVALMTMREDDESGAVFWASAIDGLRVAGVDVSDVPAPAAAEGVDRPMLAGLIRRVNAHPTPVVWVLDCGEFSLPPTLGDGLHRLIESCPEQLRLVLLTRADPPLPLHRYRLSGTITEIRAADLVFTASEASTLLNGAGLDLAPLDAVMLRSRTGGWPAGLQFAAMTLAGRVDIESAIDEFRGDSGNVAAYLTREVYAKQPRRIRQFLLRTCLVDEVNPRLATALTGQDCETGVLQFVARGNAFMEPVPGRPGCYRYQPLFREFLRSQLSFEHPELKPVLHRAAAEQLAGDGMILSALQHAVAAGDWSLATRFLVDGLWFGGLLVGGHRTLLRNLFAPMPPELAEAEAAVTRATLALVERDRVVCDHELDMARRFVDEGSAGALRRPCALAISILAAVSASLGDDPVMGVDRVLAAEVALLAAPPETRDLHPDLLAVLARSKATVLVDRGELGTALEALDEGMAAASAPHLGDVLEELQGMAALAHALNGDLRQAERIAARLAPLGVEAASGWARVPRTAVAALAWARLDEYDMREARSLLRCAEDGASSYDSNLVDGILSLLQARLFAAEGKLELARSALRAMPNGSQPGSDSSWLQRARTLAEARLLLAQSRPREAAAVARGVTGEDHLDRDLVLRRALLADGSPLHALSEPSSRALEHVPLEVRVDVWLALTEQSVCEGDDARGEACLEHALRLAAPERLRRPFLEARPDVRALLERKGLAGRTRWLNPEAPLHAEPPMNNGHGQHPRPPVNNSARAKPLVIPLTKKELEVLGHLAELLTTEEIAEAMYVSVNTVRSHVRNILRKLGVARRNEAVRRAWDLQLLPPPNVA